MRNIFLDELCKIAREDERVLLLMGECGYSVTEKFEQEFPDRFYNTGIAEQSLIGITAGTALRDFKPVAYDMVPFLTMRAYEQIRVDVCYQNLPVILVGVGSGLSYGITGATHHCIEELAIMRALPNMTIVLPSNELDVRQAARQAFELNSPVYLSFGRNPGKYDINYSPADFKIGKAIRLTEGLDAAIFACGYMVSTAMEIKEQLAMKNVTVSVYNMHTVKPIDKEAIINAMGAHKLVISLEEHNILGGLGGAMAEVVSEMDSRKARFRRFGVNDFYHEFAGSQNYLHREAGIDVDSILNGIMELLEG